MLKATKLEGEKKDKSHTLAIAIKMWFGVERFAIWVIKSFDMYFPLHFITLKTIIDFIGGVALFNVPI